MLIVWRVRRGVLYRKRSRERRARYRWKYPALLSARAMHRRKIPRRRPRGRIQTPALGRPRRGPRWGQNLGNWKNRIRRSPVLPAGARPARGGGGGGGPPPSFFSV